MKILLINKFHFPKGGSESYYFALGDALRSLGHEVIWFSMKDEKNVPCPQSGYFSRHVGLEEGQSALEKIRTALRFIYSPQAGRSIAALIEKEKPDVAHLNLVHRHLTFSIVNRLKKNDVPMVFTMHDLIALCPCYTMLSNGKVCDKCANGNPFYCVKNRCVRGSMFTSLLSTLEAVYLRLSRGYDKINLYIAPSRFLRDRLVKSGFSKSPVLYKCNFLAPDFVYERSDQPGGYLLYAGRLSPEKGLRTLLKAYVAAKPEADLYVAGDGPEREWAEQFVEKSGMGSRIRLLGHLDRASMADVMAKSRAIVVPSEWYENCPYSIMEAMGKGKPVVAADTGGIPELVKDGKTGWLFRAFDQAELEKALVKVVNMTDGEYEAMCQAALDEAVSRFDAKRYARDMVEIYEKLVSGEKVEG
ncbi:MAG: glycosyltransferase family 4 protein [Clostridia bacterium]|nr:glycosyltransferase family 4 protein [Clostridia bacterium]